LISRSPYPKICQMNADPLNVEHFGGSGTGPGVLCLRGPLVKENINSFQNAVRREDAAETMILDFSEVPYMDSSGLGSLVNAYFTRRKAGRRVALTGVNDRVYKLLQITKLENQFLIFSTIDEAVAAFGGAAEA
jgi:anti-sigma B factor antagonist